MNIGYAAIGSTLYHFHLLYILRTTILTRYTAVMWPYRTVGDFAWAIYGPVSCTVVPV